MRERIAVFRALNLGDMLCAVPALRALRRRFPDADIALVGLPWAEAFQRRYARYLDRFFPFPGYPGLPEAAPGPGEPEGFLARMRAQRFDLCLQMHGCGPASNTVVGRMGACATLGLGVCEGDPHVQVWPYPHGKHEVQRNLYLLQQGLGLSAADDRLEFPLMEQDWAELDARPELGDCRTAPYACLHPGARDPAKRWAPRDFAAVGDALAARGLRVVLTGSASERPIALEVARHMRSRAWNAACDISVGGLAALIAGARLLVSNDTGAAHLASALGVPSVVVFFATDPVRWGPPAYGPHRVAGGSDKPTVGRVMEQAEALLEMAPALRRTETAQA